eukprot:TRINITY_DN72772_c0_g1_i1.p1 TRINITY_DN72772_c0_g1~~TRINITY_DN72772_c0_g1_i1.p1  ORF type:complete len:294 (+),score=32.15 TRINITY_DN72772_c0_g1_i1:100-981(+)
MLHSMEDDSLETISIPACGEQAESCKASAPAWSLPRATRGSAQRLHISAKHKQDLVGRDSPGPCAYSPPRPKTTSCSFGTASRFSPSRSRYPEASNDLLDASPDSSSVKFHSTTSTVMGFSTKRAAWIAPDLNCFPAGVDSPGPQRYNPERSPSSPKFSIGRSKRSQITGESCCTPERVGPGLYPPGTPDMQSQSLSSPKFSMGKAVRWKAPKKSRPVDFWDGMGEQKLVFNRTQSSPSSFSFGKASRWLEKPPRVVKTALDQGPEGTLEPLELHVPELPPRVGPGGYLITPF